MKNKFLLLCIFLPMWFLGYSQAEETCAPVKNGKICYSDDVTVGNMSKERLYDAINKWAVKAYGTDVFFSNVSSNKARASILISSKMELLLNEEDKTFIKFRMRINCLENRYTVEVTDIVYQYDPLNGRSYKTYPAENVILNEGKNNSVEIIKDPRLFCDATHDFAQKLMAKVFDIVKKR